MSKKNKRVLTHLLERAGQKEILSPKGYPTTHAREAAEKMWELATTGRVIFDEDHVIQASTRDWKDTVAWIFTQIDGPVRVADQDETNPIGAMSLDELVKRSQALADKIKRASEGGEDE